MNDTQYSIQEGVRARPAYAKGDNGKDLFSESRLRNDGLERAIKKAKYITLQNIYVFLNFKRRLDVINYYFVQKRVF